MDLWNINLKVNKNLMCNPKLNLNPFSFSINIQLFSKKESILLKCLSFALDTRNKVLNIANDKLMFERIMQSRQEIQAN